MSAEIGSNNLSNILNDFGFAKTGLNSALQNKPAEMPQSEPDKLDLSTKKEPETKWGKWLAIGSALAATIGGGIYWLKRGKKPAGMKEAVETVTESIPELQRSVKELEGEMKRLSVKRFVDDTPVEGVRNKTLGFVKRVELADMKRDMADCQREIEEVSEASPQIMKFVNTKILNNSEIQEEMGWLKTLRNMYQTDDNTYQQCKGLFKLDLVLEDAILAKVNPERATEVDEVLRAFTGSSLEKVTQKFDSAKGKPLSELGNIFADELKFLANKDQELRESGFLKSLDDLFVSKRGLDVFIDSNKEGYRHIFIDPLKYFGHKHSKYRPLEFIPEELRGALTKSRRYYGFDPDNINIIEANKRGIKEIQQSIDDTKELIDQRKAEYKASDTYKQFWQKRQEYIAAKKRLKELTAGQK